MAILKDSETKLNLMKAFAGESQARNRYTFAASVAKSQGIHVIEAIFTFTANQEKEHAEIFYNHLKELSGETIHIEGGYPTDNSNSLSDLLKFAQHNEYEEYDIVYKQFAKKAKEEGFSSIAGSFEMIAEIEKIHGDRFNAYAQMLEQNKLFSSEQKCRWFCLNCGHIHESENAPTQCPVCSHQQGFFIRAEHSPYGIF